jgi:Protein of unknown function (DUF2844)
VCQEILARAIAALIAIMILRGPDVAMATLGGSAESIAADQQALGGQVQRFEQPQLSTGEEARQQQMPAPAGAAYTVEQISTPRGEAIKEYLSPSGTVFAVTWRGPRPPDLSQLLGSYFAEYQTAVASRRPQRGHLRVQSPNLVVEGSGHVRDLRGRAYDPTLLPAGVNVDEIQ